MKCDYKNSLQVCRGDGKATQNVIVVYNPVADERLALCNDCTDYVGLDAKKSGYIFLKGDIDFNEYRTNAYKRKEV